MKVLVNCTGFIGDILFASCLAKKIKIMMPQAEITYNIPLPQPKLLLEENPNIDHVVVQQYMDPREFRYVFDIPTVDQNYPATIQFQNAVGIPQEIQSPEFYVHTVPKWDAWAEKERERYQSIGPGFPLIAYQIDWSWRAYACTKETLEQGIGAPHRNTDKILGRLMDTVQLVGVGYNRDTPSSHSSTQDPEDYAKAASTIKSCDWFIGAEGGLSNLAAGVGTKCIITTDFIEQNYGKRGRVKRIENPQMGPAVYFPKAGHVHLDPCITDDEIIAEIIRIVKT
jgi:hypothetical protein